jgi:hypothetical protein
LTELKNNFDVIITTDDIDKGKPDHTAFITALNRMKTDTSEALVVYRMPVMSERCKQGRNTIYNNNIKQILPSI